MLEDANKNQRHNCNPAQNITQSPAEGQVLHGSLSKKQRKAKASAEDLKRKISFSSLLRDEGLPLTRFPYGWACDCPHCVDLALSFLVREDDRSAICLRCGWSGDIVRYTKHRYDISAKQAVKLLKKVSPALLKENHPEEASPAFMQLPESRRRAIGVSSYMLGYEPERLDDYWLPSTVVKLAKERSLGCFGTGIAYNYDTGMHVEDLVLELDYWAFGTPSIWRAHQAQFASRVFICDTEYAAVSLVDNGIEELNCDAVVAIPSLEHARSGLASLLKGKQAILCVRDKHTDSLIEHSLGMLEDAAESVICMDLDDIINGNKISE